MCSKSWTFHNVLHVFSGKRHPYQQIHENKIVTDRQQLRRAFRQIGKDRTYRKLHFYQYLSAWRVLVSNGNPNWKDKFDLLGVCMRLEDIVKRHGLQSLDYQAEETLPECQKSLNLFEEIHREYEEKCMRPCKKTM